MKVAENNILNNVQIRKRFTEFDVLIYKQELFLKRKFETLELTNEKQNCRLTN